MAKEEDLKTRTLDLIDSLIDRVAALEEGSNKEATDKKGDGKEQQKKQEQEHPNDKDVCQIVDNMLPNF